MARSVGLDVHKRSVEVCILDTKGKVVFRGRLDCNRTTLESFARKNLRSSDRVALEATTNTWPVVEILRPLVKQVVVGNPLKTRAIADAKVKTDKVDAEVLAQLLRCDYLPDVWQPDSQTQMLRSLTTHRTGLMAQRTRHKNRVRCLLAGLLIQPPCKCLWTKAGVQWLKQLKLPATERLILDSELRQLVAIEQEISSLDERLIQLAGDDKRVQLLMTLPGVSHVVAIGLLAALGDVERFADGDHAASYLGLVPRTKQSGDRCYNGRITKAGNSQARWLLTQSCQHVARHPGPLGAFFRRLAKRKKRQVAIIAVARKLVTIAVLMLKNNEPYRYAKPQLIATKLGKLISATQGQRAKRKRTQKSLPSRARDGLAAVYESVELPAPRVPDELAAAEQRMLADHQVLDYVEGLYTPADNSKKKTKPKKSSPTRAAR